MWRSHDECSKTTNWWQQSSRCDPVPTSACSVLENEQWNLDMYLILHKCDFRWEVTIHWWLHATELFVMWRVAAWPLLGPISRCSVTCAGLCGLVEGWVPIDASSGCPVIDWAVETRRWCAGWWPWWWPGRHAPLDWNSYCVHELAHNTFVFYLFYLLTIIASA